MTIWVFDLNYTLCTYDVSKHKKTKNRIAKYNKNVINLMKKIGKNRIIFSNSNQEYCYTQLKHSDLKSQVDKVFCRMKKPNLDAYETIENYISTLDVNDEPVIFFDDEAKNLIAAKQFGWITVLVGDEPDNIPVNVDYYFETIQEALESLEIFI